MTYREERLLLVDERVIGVEISLDNHLPPGISILILQLEHSRDTQPAPGQQLLEREAIRLNLRGDLLDSIVGELCGPRRAFPIMRHILDPPQVDGMGVGIE